MEKKIISLAQKFIAMRTIPDKKNELKKILETALLQLKKFKIERFEKNGSQSALIYNVTKRPKRFKILLNGHLDVIPGKDFQYTPKTIGDRLFGVGALDMKGSAACLIMAFSEVAKKVKYPLALQLVTDEEIGGFNGTKYQVDSGVRADFVISGEATQFNIANEAKGILWLKISASGKTAHGAYPWKGNNAIVKMNNFIATLSRLYPVPAETKWKTTINISKIETQNNSFNKVPDDCTVWLDIRYIPKESRSILKNIRNIVPNGFTVEVVLKEPSMYVDPKNEYVRKLQEDARGITKRKVQLYGAQGSSDARHFTRVNCVGIEFGPIGAGIGTDNEWVSRKSLGLYFEILKKFLLHV